MPEGAAREEILASVKLALKQVEAGSASAQEAPGRSAAYSVDQVAREIRKNCGIRREDLIHQFDVELTKVGGHFYRAHNAESAIQYIQKVASDRQTSSIIGSAQVMNGYALKTRLQDDHIEFITETNAPEFLQAAATAGIGLSNVDYVLADTGTLVLLACAGQPRSISLLPPVHIALIKPEQIISGLDDLFPLLRQESHAAMRDLSSAVTFITGPSRTADIELTLVVGVHGPQELHVVLES
ncbi:MAG: lactate utilization protein [Blastocatellia bacterium]